MIESHRAEFYDTLQDLCDAAEDVLDVGRSIWKAEYISRDGRRYLYFGVTRGNTTSAMGYEHDLETGDARDLDPCTLIFTFLNFATNRVIGGYSGERASAVDISHELQALDGPGPEVVRIAIETHESLPSGRSVITVTDVAFVGLETAATPCPWVAPSKRVSRRWFRGRRYYGALAHSDQD